MVSLKSFKLIVDGERDEPEQHQINATSQSISDHHLHRHPNQSDRPSTFYDAHDELIENSKATTRGKLEAMLNDNPLQVITDDHNEGSINQDSSNKCISNDVKLNSTEMTTLNHGQSPLNKGSSEINLVNKVGDMSDMRKQDFNNKSVVKFSLKNPNSDEYKSAPEVQSTATITTATTVASPSSSPNDNLEEDSANTVSPSSSSISIVVVQHGNSPNQKQTTSDSDYAHDGSSSQSLDDLDEAVESNGGRDMPSPSVRVPVNLDGNYYDTNGVSKGVLNNNLQMYQKITRGKGNGSGLSGSLMDPRFPTTATTTPLGSEHFEIVWSNLSYRIEPKWYKKINFLDQIFSHFLPGQTIDNHSSATSTASSSAGMNDNQHQMHASANADSHLHNTLNSKHKSSLDPLEIFTNLNGTIKSGQMTAVLGPSGKYKIQLIFLYCT